MTPIVSAPGAEPAVQVSVVRFTTSQLLQVIGLLVAGLLAWGNLKADLRGGFSDTNGRLNALEWRVSRLEPGGTAGVPRPTPTVGGPGSAP